MRVRVLMSLAGVLGAASIAASSASAASSVYWSDHNSDSIPFINLDGTGMSSDFVPAAPGSISGPLGVAVDPELGKIYWTTDFSPYSIDVANLDGSDAGDLDTGTANVDYPEGLSIDPANGDIYWANDIGNTIGYTALNGSGAGANLKTTGATVDAPAGVTVDTANGRLYWGNQQGGSMGKGSIAYVNLDGSGAGGALSTAATVAGPDGIAIDPGNGRIYWANSDTDVNTIAYADLDGTDGGTFNVGTAALSVPTGLAIDPVSGKLYWANFDSPTSISWADLDGDGVSGKLATTSNAEVASPAYPILFKTPESATAPALSGPTTPGSTLTCVPGTWAADLPSEFDYRAPNTATTQSWSRNGVPIAGATGTTLPASSPGTYACESTAGNGAGTSTQTSTPIVVTAPAGKQPAGGTGSSGPTAAQIAAGLQAQLVPKGAGARIRSLLKHGYPLSFNALTAGKLVVDWYYLPRGARIARAKRKPAPVLVGAGKATVSRVGKVHLTIRLTRAGKRLLKHSKHLKLTAKGTFELPGHAPISATRTFSLRR